MYFTIPNRLSAWLLTLYLLTQVASVPVDVQEPLSSDLKVNFRNGTVSDLDDIVTIIIDAFAPGDAFKYTHPGYERFKEYTKCCTREEIKRRWDDVEWKGTIVKVITVPDDHTSSSGKERAVATAVWVTKSEEEDGDEGSLTEAIWNIVYNQPPISLMDKPDDSLYDCSLHLGSNMTRSDDFRRQLMQAEQDTIDSQFTKHLYLAVLATHPTWDGHNFGAMNLHWGMRFAKARDIPVTLIATPEGYPLYDSLGFQSLKNVTIHKLDGERDLWYEAMVFDG